MPADATNARSPHEFRGSEISTQKEDPNWVTIQTDHRLRKRPDVKMRSLGQSERKASKMFAQFLLLLLGVHF